MPPAAPPSTDRSPHVVPAVMPSPTAAAEMAAKDAIIAWYRGEFAAANAIIDALCGHIAAQSPNPTEYDAVFAAIHRRRLNWIPVIQMQKYFSITDVAAELHRVADQTKREKEIGVLGGGDAREVSKTENYCNGNGSSVGGGGGGDGDEDSRDESQITDSGSDEVQVSPQHIEICDYHEECGVRREQIKMTKGFVAKEPVNVVKGLKLYEDVFTSAELLKLNDMADELRTAGQNGELSGETYILFNKQIKGNKREQIQLGVPVFGQIKDEAADDQQKITVDPIPELLQSVLDHLVQWQILPENRKPNGCIINYFDEGEYSQPYLKPPHLDQPLCTLLLSESTIAFGRSVVCDADGNFKGQLVLTLKGGSLIVMRNNSADMARHVMCPSSTRRVSITFFRVRPDTDHRYQSTTLTPLNQTMTVWHPGTIPSSPRVQNGPPNGYEVAMDLIPKWGIVRSPSVVMLAPLRPMVVSPRKMPNGGTGVFLPWTVGSRRPARHLPPRAQKARLLALPSTEARVSDTMSDPGTLEGMKMI
ncbi:RNA demethylase ALKBH10B-like protein [Drosera capensis]